MSKFQLVLLIVFGVFIVAAVMLFSFYKGSRNNPSVNLVVWGTIPTYQWNSFIQASPLGNSQTVNLTYVEKASNAIESDFVNALASGSGPDIIILTQDQFIKDKNKLSPIPYSSVSESTFKSTFIEEGELFLQPDGIYGLPLVVDPMVLYSNRDILSTAGIAEPISHWDEIYDQAAKINSKDGAGNITKTVMALGESSNIPDSKDLLSMLMMQAGTPISGVVNGRLQSELSNSFDLPTLPATAALDFYTQFSNPTKAFYSWNRSLPSADANFAAGNAAYYAGFASELTKLRAKNPTLNLAVSKVPQSRVSGKAITYGKLYALAFPKVSRNLSSAMSAAFQMVGSADVQNLSNTLSLPPARRDLLTNKPTDDVFAVFYSSALISRGWLDPDTAATASLWKNMIEGVTSGRSRTDEAVTGANGQLQALMK